MFNVGDTVKAKERTPYAITTNGWVGVVETMDHGYIVVRGTNGYSYTVEPRYFTLVKPAKIKEEIKMNANEIITNEERETLLKEMEGLLDEYGYDYTEDALNTIIDTWAEDKADLITAFKKHPNYLEGKFMIVFSHNFDRTVDMDAVIRFKNWLMNYNVVTFVREFMPDAMRAKVVSNERKYPNDIYNFFIDIVNQTSQYISQVIADKANAICANFHAREGQKMSRIVNKVCDYVGLTKLPDYNKEFAKYADAINPLQITRHNVLSVNPLDYLTMSFGNSWASCHTIDKENKRHMPNSYQGMYSSGTISYMLDSTSMVFYTVDASYNGNDFWNEPKINRQMFHWGEQKLIQGRLYPQDNDNNAEGYKPYREIVQKIMSELFGFSNYWIVKKGTSEAGRYIISKGTHYKDYDCYRNCNLSVPKGTENEECITVGHDPICIQCGDEHDVKDNINHCAERLFCAACGCVIVDEDEDGVWINGQLYCRDCVSYCDCCGEYTHDGVTYIESEDRYVCDDCLSRYYEYCEDCGDYYDRDNMTFVESENAYFCNDCIEDGFCTCGHCNQLFRNRVLTEFDDEELCSDCLEEAETEAEANEEAM